VLRIVQRGAFEPWSFGLLVAMDKMGRGRGGEGGGEREVLNGVCEIWNGFYKKTEFQGIIESSRGISNFYGVNIRNKNRLGGI